MDMLANVLVILHAQSKRLGRDKLPTLAADCEIFLFPVVGLLADYRLFKPNSPWLLLGFASKVRPDVPGAVYLIGTSGLISRLATVKSELPRAAV
jgi:hypothetical protein